MSQYYKVRAIKLVKHNGFDRVPGDVNTQDFVVDASTKDSLIAIGRVTVIGTATPPVSPSTSPLAMYTDGDGVGSSLDQTSAQAVGRTIDGRYRYVVTTLTVDAINIGIAILAALQTGIGGSPGLLVMVDGQYTGFTKDKYVVAKSGIDMLGVTPHLVNAGVIPDQQWSADYGTRFVGDGTQECYGIVDDAAINPSLTGTTNAGFPNDALRNVSIHNIEFSNFDEGMRLGGINRHGPLNCRFGSLYARNCIGPGFHIINWMRLTVDGEIWTYQCDGQLWEFDLAYTVLQPGNSILPNLTNVNLQAYIGGKPRKGIQFLSRGVPASSTYTGSINGTVLSVTSIASGIPAPGQTLSGAGITAGTKVVKKLGDNTFRVDTNQVAASTTITATATAYSSLGGVSKVDRPQSNQFASSLPDKAATCDGLNPWINVADTSVYRVDLGVYPAANFSGLFANRTYFITSVDDANSRIQIANEMGGAPLTPTAGSGTIKSNGFSGFVIAGTNGGQWGGLTWDGIDVEGQSTTAFHVQNVLQCYFLFQAIQSGTTQVANSFSLRNALQCILDVPSPLCYYDADANSSSSKMRSQTDPSYARQAMLSGELAGCMNLYGTAANGAGNNWQPTLSHVNPGGLPWTYPGIAIGQRCSVKSASFTVSTWEFGSTDVISLSANATATMPTWTDTSALNTHVGGGGELTNASDYYLTVNTDGTQKFNNKTGLTSLVLGPGETLLWRPARTTASAYSGGTGANVYVKASVMTSPNWHTWPSYASDAAAKTGGVPIGGNYRNGSSLCKVVS